MNRGAAYLQTFYGLLTQILLISLWNQSCWISQRGDFRQEAFMSDVMALVGFLGLLALLIPRLRDQRSQVVKRDVDVAGASRTATPQ